MTGNRKSSEIRQRRQKGLAEPGTLRVEAMGLRTVQMLIHGDRRLYGSSQAMQAHLRNCRALFCATVTA